MSGSDVSQIQLGLTHPFDCSYLPDKQEQLLVVLGTEAYNTVTYEALINLGFRRSGDQVYRPRCPSCQACKSLRLDVALYQPSRSQKRIVSRNKKFTVELLDDVTDAFYPLFERYINERHSDGSMYPASFEQFMGFIPCNWLDVKFLCTFDEDKLISVAVLDWMQNSTSAVYTFFDPDYIKESLGAFSIIKSIEITRLANKTHLYLGYQIDECQKMSYKRQYRPHQEFEGNIWQTKLK